MARRPAVNAREEFKKRIEMSGLAKSAVALECDRCHAHVSSDTRWRCGRCGFENHRTNLYSFLNKCQKCEEAPTSLVCPRCDRPITLVDGQDSRFSATVAVERKKHLPKEEPSQRERRVHAKEKERLVRAIEIAELEAKLMQARKLGEIEKSEDERKHSEITAYVARIMGYHKALGKAKEQAAVDYKDDADGLEKVNMALEQWRETHLE